MPARKMRMEVYDTAGNRYTVTFEGRVSRDKALLLLDLIELLGGMPESRSDWPRHNPELSKFDKVRLIAETHFPAVWFSAKDLQRTYEQQFKKPIKLSTVSTYLSRMVDRGILVVGGASRARRYRISTEITRLAGVSH